MGIDFKKVGKFISENRGYIFYGLSAILTAVVGARYGINVGTVGGSINIEDLNKPSVNLDFAMNSKQAAIASLTKSACATGYSWTKEDAIKKIYDIIADSTNDADRMYAIRSIQAISGGTGYSWVKDSAQKYITAIAKAGG